MPSDPIDSEARYTVYKVAGGKRRSALWLRLLRWTALVVIVCIAAVAGSWFGWLQNTVAQLAEKNPVTVEQTRKELVPDLPGEAMNILVLGSDHRYQYGSGDVGRSDTLMLLRLDPKTKSVSILSVPRDLRVQIPGHGADRINTAYAVGGPALSVKTFKSVTGLPVHHFMEVDFVGFSNIVDALGGVYLDVDRRYYNPKDTGWAAIDIKPGYQNLNGHDALQFARFRHDATGDFGRMVRQQTFIRELKRQSFRWDNWRRIPRVVKMVTKNTTSDLSSLRQWLSLARLVLEVDTSRVYSTHLVARGIMVNGASELEASPAEIAAVVEQFTHPDKAAVKPPEGKKMPKDSFVVYVSNGGAGAGTASRVAAQLNDEGYKAVVAGDLTPARGGATTIYASRSYSGNAKGIAALMKPAKVVRLDRQDGTVAGVSVVVGSSFGGKLTMQPKHSVTAYGQQIQYGANHDAAAWRQFTRGTPIKVRMPTAWVSGCTYDWADSRKYRIPTGDGDAAALCVVGETALGEYWHIQQMRWTDPPAVAAPDETRTIGGTDYMLFYNGAKRHMIAWQVDNTLYWVSNTLGNDLSNDAMLALATSFKPVK